MSSDETPKVEPAPQPANQPPGYSPIFYKDNWYRRVIKTHGEAIFCREHPDLAKYIDQPSGLLT